MNVPEALIADRYRLVARVGSGGMGVVWEAWDERLERRVALKQLSLPPGVSEVEADLAKNRAMREARISARLHHRNAVPVFDVVEHQGQPCLIMQFVSSVPLSTVLRDGGLLAPPEAVRVGREIAGALAAAHAIGIVHRDVKPGNILIDDDGTAMISDFGISHALGDPTLTATGMFHGTPAYLSPEAARGAPGTAASDVYSLGATLYATLEGSPPFGTDQNPIALLHRVAAGKFVPPTRSGPLAPLITRMLAADPDARPSMHEVAASLARPAAEEGTSAPVQERDAATVRRPAPSPTAVLEPPANPVRPAVREPAPPLAPVSTAAPAQYSDAGQGTRPRQRRGLWMLLGLVLVASIVGLGWAVLSGQLSQQTGGAADPAPPSTTSSTAAGPATSAGPTSQAPTPTPTRASPRSPSPSSPPTPTATRPSPTPTRPSPTPTQPTPTPTATRSPTPAPSPTPPPVSGTPTAGELTAAVTSYYGQMPRGTDGGWQQLTGRYQSGTAGGRGSYERFWRAINAVSVRNVSASPPGNVQALVTYNFADGRVVRELTSYRLVEQGGVLKIDGSSVISSTG